MDLQQRETQHGIGGITPAMKLKTAAGILRLDPIKNGGGLPRRLPREIDPTTVSNHQLKMICDRPNATPLKCLEWKTPS